MAPLYLILALVVQCSFIHADTDVSEDREDLRETLQKPDIDDEATKDFASIPLDANWFELFTPPGDGNTSPSPSAAKMARVASSNKTVEEQLNDMQQLAQEMSAAMEAEMVGLMSYAMAHSEQHVDENGARTRRSPETPMDSTEMVMRLLKHIKSNNEYQNIAIDKMMSAQEIAEKFGIEFNPDPEILSELALAAHEHARDISGLLRDARDLNNLTAETVQFVPAVAEPAHENDTYYTYGSLPAGGPAGAGRGAPPFEYVPDTVSQPRPLDRVHYADVLPLFASPFETQVSPPPAHHHTSPVTPKPSFCDPFVHPFTPAADYYSPYSGLEPFVYAEDPEPELVGEEVEETVTSRTIVEKGDEPGTTTVNHVTSYVISEKSHFKPPQIEQLPQHFQYCFFLI